MNLTRTGIERSLQATPLSQTEVSGLIPDLEYYAGEVPPPSVEQWASLDTQILIRDAIRWLKRPNEKIDRPAIYRDESAAEAMRTQGASVIAPPDYFENLFILSDISPQTDQSRINERRLESLFVGAAAYGEDALAKASLDRVVQLRGGYDQALEEELTGIIGEARNREMTIEAVGNAVRETLSMLRSTDQETLEQQTRAGNLASKRSRRLWNVIEFMLPKYHRPANGRPAQDSRVVWRPTQDLFTDLL